MAARRGFSGLLSAVVPLAAGGAIYLLGRPRGLLMFRWCRALGLASALDSARALCAPWARAAPDWLLYSLPNALWVYSFAALMAATWQREWTRASAAWILLGPLLGVSWELGQLAGVVAGTFDAMDLLLVCCASVAALRGVAWPVEAPLEVPT